MKNQKPCWTRKIQPAFLCCKKDVLSLPCLGLCWVFLSVANWFVVGSELLSVALTSQICPEASQVSRQYAVGQSLKGIAANLKDKDNKEVKASDFFSGKKVWP